MQPLFVVIGPVLVLWLVMSRVPRIRWVVAAGLAAILVAVGVLAALLPRGSAEILVVGLLLAGGAVLAGRRAERRIAGPATGLRARAPAWLLGGWLGLLACGVGLMVRPGPFHPGAGLVLPLPGGLTAVAEPTGAGSCGTGMCTTHLTVTGRAGQTDADLISELRRHLESRGWGDGCRPVGWLLVPGRACANVVTHNGQVTISLTGLRDE